jgi:hypothetical protein
MSRNILAVLVLLVCVFAIAQKSDDADKQKLIEIEQKFAAITSFNSPEMTDAFQKHLYDGTSSLLVLFGHLYRGPKADAVAATKKPDPNDPDQKMTNKLSDLQVDTYGDTALVSYKLVETDSGHKNPALNGDYRLTCLDTYVKRKGDWYMIGSSCVPNAPMSQAQWDAFTKMVEQSKQQQKPPSQ